MRLVVACYASADGNNRKAVVVLFGAGDQWQASVLGAALAKKVPGGRREGGRNHAPQGAANH